MRDRSGAGPGSVRDEAQPSLWDRLVDDLPGIAAEIEDLRSVLGADLGDERLDGLLARGLRGIEAEPGLSPAQRHQLVRLDKLERRREILSARGIVVSPEVFREAVRRDLEMLFNTQRYECGLPAAPGEQSGVVTEHDLADFPEVRRSVLNYGVPALAGHTAREFDRDGLARELKSVLAAFEPRLRESATRVTVLPPDPAGGLVIEIDSLLMLAPVPERLRLRTTIDLDNGQARTSLREA